MALYPENWLEWEWGIENGSGAGTFDLRNARVWRVTALGTAIGGNINFSTAPPGPTNYIVVTPATAGAQLVFEPRGMFACGSVSFDVNVGRWYVEWIRQVQ